jgi:hypothetical protein
MNDAHTRSLVPLAVFIARILAANVAQAQNVMEGARCVPEQGHILTQPDDLAKIRFQTVNNHSAITNGSQTDTATVHCPILKTTSGPGVVNDQLWFVGITLAGPASGSTCTLNVWQMSTSSAFNMNMGPLKVDTQSTDTNSSTINGPGTYTMYVEQGGSFHGYWGDDQTWSYADATCTLSPGASITYYTVGEEGSPQNSLLLPSTMCQQEVTNTAGFNYAGFGVGLLESVESNPGTGFQFGCPLFANGFVNIKALVGPSIAGPIAGIPASQLTCWLDEDLLNSIQTAPQLPLGCGPTGTCRDFPADVLWWTRTQPWSTGRFTCGLWQNETTLVSNGDGKIYSYKLW